MGWNASALHARAKSQEVVASSLRSIVHKRALVTRPKNQWVSVYDEGSEASFEEGHRVGLELSTDLQSVVVFMMVFSSGVLQYALFDRGQQVDEFNSRPDYFAPSRATYADRTRGNPSVLRVYCRAEVSERELKRLLDRSAAVFSGNEEQRLRELARALGIDPGRAEMSYGNVTGSRALNCVKVEPFQLREREALGARVVPLGDNPLVTLRAAILRGDVEGVRIGLDRGISPDAINEHGSSLLHCAVYHPNANVSIVRVLLEAGARVDAPLDVEVIGHGRHRPQWRALHYAAMIAPVDVVDLLLTAGASVDAAAGDGRTPLMVASFEARPDVVARLLDAGADKTRIDSDSRAALQWAMKAAQRGGDLANRAEAVQRMLRQ